MKNLEQIGRTHQQTARGNTPLHYCFDRGLGSIVIRREATEGPEPYAVNAPVTADWARARITTLQERLAGLRWAPGTFLRGYEAEFYEPLIGDLERALEDWEYHQGQTP